VLTAIEARVLGCLMEKQATTPDVYPLTLKALTTACNQSSSRDPVMNVTEREVETTVLALKALGYARVVHPGAGERATKYRHIADEALGVDGRLRAVLAVLLLRGPQTVAELRARTERLYAFPDAADVEAALGELARRDPPLATRLERQPGEREARWLQLLAEEAIPLEERSAAGSAAGSASPRSDRVAELEARVAALEERLAALESLF
jgi:uncharacterized protein YceH (UPF0502 family)